jgi:hypothetical protein
VERKNAIGGLFSGASERRISGSRRSQVAGRLTAEDVTYWYLRLNGFLTIQNFIVHGNRRGRTKTDIDVLGVSL